MVHRATSGALDAFRYSLSTEFTIIKDAMSDNHHSA